MCVEPMGLVPKPNKPKLIKVTKEFLNRRVSFVGDKQSFYYNKVLENSPKNHVFEDTSLLKLTSKTSTI